MYVCIYIIYCTKTYYLSLSLHIYIHNMEYTTTNHPRLRLQVFPRLERRHRQTCRKAANSLAAGIRGWGSVLVSQYI